MCHENGFLVLLGENTPPPLFDKAFMTLIGTVGTPVSSIFQMRLSE